jgi:hypothetical protein
MATRVRLSNIFRKVRAHVCTYRNPRSKRFEFEFEFIGSQIRVKFTEIPLQIAATTGIIIRITRLLPSYTKSNKRVTGAIDR